MGTILLAIAGTIVVLALLIVWGVRIGQSRKQARKKAHKEELKKLRIGAALAASGFQQLDLLIQDEIIRTYQEHGLEQLRVDSVRAGTKARSEFVSIGDQLVGMFNHWYGLIETEDYTLGRYLQECLVFYRGYDQLQYCQKMVAVQVGRDTEQLHDLLNRTLRMAFRLYAEAARNGDRSAFVAARQIYIDAGASYDLRTIDVRQPQLPDDWDELQARYSA